MAERIPQSFIDEIINRTDIVDLIDGYVPLKKAGSNYSARCPFHEEKTPSFTVSPDKQFYHCFGCGAHGTAISFLMEYERLGFIDAIEQLAHRAGLKVPRDTTHVADEQASNIDYELLEQCARLFQQQLREHQVAIDYLKQRGLIGETAKKFSIGFAPPGWQNLLNALGSTPEIQTKLLEYGLLIKNEQGRLYDRFRNRIMFPIRDVRGRTIAFGGRVIDKNDTPKYLNSPESVAFHKGKELYGLWEAKQAQRRLDKIIIVEGYMDVVMLAQHGITYSVATLGTAATARHVERLFRNSSELIFCFDGDDAGRNAALRALQHTLPAMKEGRQARFMFLAEGEDPDSLVQKLGAQQFSALTEQATPLSEFFLEHLQTQTDMRSLDGRARLIELARPLLATVPNGVYKELLTDELAQRAKTNAQTVISGTAKPAPAKPQAATPPPPRRIPNNLAPQSPVARAITLLIQHPNLAEGIATPIWPQNHALPGAILLLALIEKLRNNPNLSTASLLESWRDSEHSPTLAKLASKPLLTPKNGLKHELKGALEKINLLFAEQRADFLLQKDPNELTLAERTELAELLGQGKR